MTHQIPQKKIILTSKIVMTHQIKSHKKDNFDFQDSDDTSNQIPQKKKDNFDFQDSDDTSNGEKTAV